MLESALQSSSYRIIRSVGKWRTSLTKAGNMKAPSRKNIVEWIIEVWSDISTECIVNLFKCCGLNLQIDGTAEDVIHCFKEGEPCASRKDKLKSQLSVLSEEVDLKNPFIKSSDEEDAAQDFNKIDEDDDIDLNTTVKTQIAMSM